ETRDACSLDPADNSIPRPFGCQDHRGNHVTIMPPLKCPTLMIPAWVSWGPAPAGHLHLDHHRHAHSTALTPSSPRLLPDPHLTCLFSCVIMHSATACRRPLRRRGTQLPSHSAVSSYDIYTAMIPAHRHRPTYRERHRRRRLGASVRPKPVLSQARACPAGAPHGLDPSGDKSSPQTLPGRQPPATVPSGSQKRDDDLGLSCVSQQDFRNLAAALRGRRSQLASCSPITPIPLTHVRPQPCLLSPIPKALRRSDQTFMDQRAFMEQVCECRDNGYLPSSKKIGSGAFSKVYLAYATQERIQHNSKLASDLRGKRHTTVAIKMVSTAEASVEFSCKFLPREISSLNATYKHLNVVQLYETYQNSWRAYLVLELAARGDLLEHINAVSDHCRCPGLEQEEARRLFWQLVSAVAHCHNSGMAEHQPHRMLYLMRQGPTLRPGLSPEKPEESQLPTSPDNVQPSADSDPPRPHLHLRRPQQQGTPPLRAP
ncbi:hypothetical protein E2I00_012085, partial [Balaenoptera physalus]